MKGIHESDNSEDSFASMFGNLMFGETVVDHEKKWQRFKRAFNERYTELRSELSEARNMAQFYEDSLANKTDNSKSEEIEKGIITLKMRGRACLPRGAFDRYSKILEEMKSIRKYVDVLSAHNLEEMTFESIAMQTAETTEPMVERCASAVQAFEKMPSLSSFVEKGIRSNIQQISKFFKWMHHSGEFEKLDIDDKGIYAVRGLNKQEVRTYEMSTGQRSTIRLIRQVMCMGKC